MQGGVPTQNYWIEASAMNALISPSLENWHDIESVLEIAASPTASAFARDYSPNEDPGGPGLSLRK